MPIRPLAESDLASADLHIVAALDILNERAPGHLTDKLVTVSDWCWTQRRQPAGADAALARIPARCAP
jgi:hypothetical protein